MAGYFGRPSLFLAGRHSWIAYFVVALLFLVILRDLSTELQDKVPNWLDSESHKSAPRPSVLRPDTIKGWTRDIKPSDDDAPLAHEPAGLGTLREVRCVMALKSTTG
jgi:uncharacterized iron-regulated membrane protein